MTSQADVVVCSWLGGIWRFGGEAWEGQRLGRERMLVGSNVTQPPPQVAISSSREHISGDQW